MCEHNLVHRQSYCCHRGNSFDHENLSPNKITERPKKRQRSQGQVVVEYVFLLILAVAIAGLAVKGCVRRNEDEPGSVIVFWNGILKTIGSDLADEPNSN